MVAVRLGILNEHVQYSICLQYVNKFQWILYLGRMAAL